MAVLAGMLRTESTSVTHTHTHTNSIKEEIRDQWSTSGSTQEGRADQRSIKAHTTNRVQRHITPEAVSVGSLGSGQRVVPAVGRGEGDSRHNP